MKKRIISKVDKTIIPINEVSDVAYIGVENRTSNNPFRKGMLASVAPGKYQMFFDGYGHINRTTDEPAPIYNIIKKYQDDIDITFYHFDTAKELYNWLAHE